MQTIKTGIVVALLLTVCYGAYVAMNAPDVQVPDDLKQWADQNGHDVVPNFDIPPITQNDSFPGGNSRTAPVEITNPQFPSVELPSVNDSNFQTSPASNQTALPAMSSSLSAAPSLSTHSNEVNGLNLPDNSVVSFPESFNPNINSQGNVTGNILPETLANSNNGPSIPFDLSNTATALSNQPGDAQGGLANDLISAGSEFVAAPLLNSANPVSPSETSSTPTRDESSQAPKRPTQTFAVAKAQALQLADQSKLREALELMTQYYESPELGYVEHTDLVDMLDALSREVIYSDRHLLNPAHTVSAQDTLQSLSTQLRINSELLAAVNRMGNTQALIAKSQIKVLEGPFHAQVSLTRGELTLFLRKMYAGRFPVSISEKNKPPMGRYEVVDRRQDRLYYGANVRIPAGDPSNPYGGYWLSLGGDYAIHGSPEQVTSDLEGAGSISLAPLDAADVYRILSKGSAVEIRN